ncbi:MAG: restriction endonuclease subunit S [Acholeplasmataceae bacterium]|jgi:type I restriction enzyme S subunit|nr:restriction endonuclease subunit S [Acholeplasmataceae bacterium]MDD4824324.1 restriction endonuclease subunit S [Acholeplasmataceae bacterium]MDY0339495.1 restriction endonuclease subunit S [Acholeplasmataceae bacterium]
MSYDTWKNVNLSDIVASVSSSFNFNRNELVLVNTSDVLEGKVLNHTFTKNLQVKGQFKKAFEKDDILYSEIRPKNKRFAYIDFDPNGYVASTKLMVLRGNKDRVDNKFLYQILTSTEMINKLQQVAESRSGTFPQITFTQLGEQEVKLPPLQQQKAIANILSSLDDKIELNNKINKNLEEMAQVLYKQWFVDFEFPNEDGEPYKSSGGEMIGSELGLIPKGWEVKGLKYICKNDIAICGKTPSTKNKDYYGVDVPFIKIPDMHNVIYVVDSNTKLSKEGQESQSNKTLPKGSICISCIGSPGLAVITIEDSQTNQQINSVIPKTEELLYYTYLNLESRAEEIKALGSAGTTLYNLNKTSFEKIKIIVPNNVVLSYFHKIIEPNFQTILNGYLQNMELSSTRDILLPKLMSGEIEVPIKG